MRSFKDKHLNKMLLFCPTCGTLLQIQEGIECNEFACKSCSYVMPVSRLVYNFYFIIFK